MPAVIVGMTKVGRVWMQTSSIYMQRNMIYVRLIYFRFRPASWQRPGRSACSLLGGYGSIKSHRITSHHAQFVPNMKFDSENTIYKSHDEVCHVHHDCVSPEPDTWQSETLSVGDAVMVRIINKTINATSIVCVVFCLEHVAIRQCMHKLIRRRPQTAVGTMAGDYLGLQSFHLDSSESHHTLQDYRDSLSHTSLCPCHASTKHKRNVALFQHHYSQQIPSLACWHRYACLAAPGCLQVTGSCNVQHQDEHCRPALQIET